MSCQGRFEGDEDEGPLTKNHFIWVKRHYRYNGSRFVVTRTFKDVVFIEEVLTGLVRGPVQSVDRRVFACGADLIDDDSHI
jgi:hypothetical protein